MRSTKTKYTKKVGFYTSKEIETIFILLSTKKEDAKLQSDMRKKISIQFGER